MLFVLLKLISISQLIKDKTPYFLKSSLVYKFLCARCNSYYIGETCRHFKTRIDEPVKKDKKSNIYTIMKHLHNMQECFSSFNSGYFSILDYAPTQFEIIIKEGMSFVSFVKYGFRLLSSSLFYVAKNNYF